MTIGPPPFQLRALLLPSRRRVHTRRSSHLIFNQVPELGPSEGGCARFLLLKFEVRSSDGFGFDYGSVPKTKTAFGKVLEKPFFGAVPVCSVHVPNDTCLRSLDTCPRFLRAVFCAFGTCLLCVCGFRVWVPRQGKGKGPFCLRRRPLLFPPCLSPRCSRLSAVSLLTSLSFLLLPLSHSPLPLLSLLYSAVLTLSFSSPLSCVLFPFPLCTSYPFISPPFRALPTLMSIRIPNTFTLVSSPRDVALLVLCIGMIVLMTEDASMRDGVKGRGSVRNASGLGRLRGHSSLLIQRQRLVDSLYRFLYALTIQSPSHIVGRPRQKAS